jgi:rod shape-determining protein MreC
LRALLSLRVRAGAGFRTAQLLHLGTETAQGTFLIDAGAEEGVIVGSPVFAAAGLVGVVKEVYRHSAQAIDWTHGEFRVSAMTADGQVYGIVEPRPGAFAEADVLILTGAPFHSDIRPGTRIVTSGRGAVFPRGIPIGEVVSIQDADTGWRKSYVVRPSVRPEAAIHVLVGTASSTEADLSHAWDVSGSRPSPAAGSEAPPGRTP